MAQVTFRVRGMSCGGCAVALQRALAQVGGVQEARVDFSAGQAVVDFDPHVAQPEALAAVVTAAGFEVASHA